MNDFDISELVKNEKSKELEHSILDDLCNAMNVNPEKYQGGLVDCILDATWLICTLKKLSKHALELEYMSGEISRSMTDNQLSHDMFDEFDNIFKSQKRNK